VTRKNREKLNSEGVVCAGRTVTIRVLRTGDPDVYKERETEAVKRRHAEISDMLASPSGLSWAENKRLKAERELLESFDARLAGTSKNVPPGIVRRTCSLKKDFRTRIMLQGIGAKNTSAF
jgi:hypothetical protein